MNCQDFNNLLKLSDFLHFNEIWPMFPPNPMYETNAIQLHFLLWFFWYISQWSGWISSIFCTRLYSKDIHCVVVSFMKKTSQGFMFFLIGKIFGAPCSIWKWCQINVYSWWLCKVCQSRSFSELHFRGVGAIWAEWGSTMVVWVVKFSREGYKIR